MSESEQTTKSGKAKVLSLSQLLAKKFTFLEGLPDKILASFGKLTRNFILIIYGASGNGKTNAILELLKALMPFGPILYISFEEGHEASMQATAIRHLAGLPDANIRFADHTMGFSQLVTRLRKQKSEQFIVIDSIQYTGWSIKQYQILKEQFGHRKTFIFISHSEGKSPDGKVAKKIEYDATIKVRVEGYIAFIRGRLGGNKPFLIWEEGARKYWGKDYEKKMEISKTKKNTKQKNEKTDTDTPENAGRNNPGVRIGAEADTGGLAEVGAECDTDRLAMEPGAD